MPVPINASREASGRARAWSSTASIAPVRSGPSAVPIATARTRPVPASCNTTTCSPGSRPKLS